MTPRAKPTSCAGCALLGHGTDFSAIEGTGSSGVMLVGEASDEHEQRDQLPFRPFAPAGGVLERTLRRMSIDRQMLSVTNCIRCRPRNNWLENSPHEYSALNHCRPNLDAAIAERRPRAIVALGGIATRELTGLAGEKLGVSYLAGYVLPGPQQIPVIPDFHPAFLRRGKASYQGVFGRILRRAMRVAAGQDRDYQWNVNPEDPSYVHAQRYTLRPTVPDCWEYSRHVLGDPRDILSYDIETNESVSLDEDAREGFADTHIRLVQFASENAGAIAIPWQREFYGAIQSLLHSPNPKCGHNVWLFDNKVLRAASAREGEDFAPRGVIHDTLAMFHHWQPDLPAHLQFAAGFVSFPFPWKHLAASDIEFYGCCDVDVTLRLYRMLEATLRRDGLCGDDCTGYIGQVYQVRPVLAAMELRGMPIDDTERRKLDAEFTVAQTALGEELAREAPPACGRVQPKSGYKGIPPEVKKFELHHDALKARFFDATSEEYYRYEMREFAVPVVDSATGAPVVHPTLRWCRVYEFNPNSRDQVKAYMVAKRHPVPKDKHREDENGESPDTTAAKELIRLSNKTGDLFYRKVVEYRGLTKMRGTYVEGFKPHEDGCVHTSFTFDTGIGQLSSRNPNIQNFPKLKPTPELAKAMRKMVAAQPGKIITEWDFKSCHVLTLGFLAEDANYIRLARLDMHSFVTGHVLGLWDGPTIMKESDDELRARFKWLKSDADRKRVRDDQAKHTILGVGNGLMPKGMYERYMENFPPQKCKLCAGTGQVPGVRALKRCTGCKGMGFISGLTVAETFHQALQKLFPKVFAWQKHIQKVAHEQQYLRTEFGHIRRFYEVFRWDPRRHDWGHGDQAEEAIAFWLANIAFGHIREKLKQLDAAGLAEKYGLFNNVHDSFLFHFDERLLEEHVREVHPVLVSPSSVLRHPTIAPAGLVIDVEGAAGRNWADMTEIDTKQFLQRDPAVAV